MSWRASYAVMNVMVQEFGGWMLKTYDVSYSVLEFVRGVWESWCVVCGYIVFYILLNPRHLAGTTRVL